MYFSLKWAGLKCLFFLVVGDGVLPGQTDVTDAVAHVAVAGKRRVKRRRFRLLVAHWRSWRKWAAFCEDNLACSDIVSLCWFNRVTLKL